MPKAPLWSIARNQATSKRQLPIMWLSLTVKKTYRQNAKEAADWAFSQGYTVHVARERHLQDRDRPALWRVYP